MKNFEGSIGIAPSTSAQGPVQTSRNHRVKLNLWNLAQHNRNCGVRFELTIEPTLH